MPIHSPIKTYLDALHAVHKTGNATEHSYRSALQSLFESTGVTALNEPKRVACGAPDFMLTRNQIPVGHCEAKEMRINLDSLKDANKAQKERYLKALPNLIYTNGLVFQFYRNGSLTRSLRIAALTGGKIIPQPEHFEALTNQLVAFAAEKPQTITSAKQLAKMLAGKAVLIKDIMGKALKDDVMLNSELTGQY